MNKDEILAKVQNNKAPLDEMETQITADAAKLAFSIATLACIGFMFFNQIYDQAYADLCAIYCSMMVSFYAYKWCKLRYNYDLIIAILFLIATLFLTAAYIIHIMHGGL